MTKTVTGLFDSYDAAASAVKTLEAAGIPHSDISIVANNSDDWYGSNNSGATRTGATDTGRDATTGAEVGAAVGGLGGLLTGLGLLAIPGVGPVVAAGWLAATAAGAVAGAAVGGAAGGIVGALTNEGVSERDAHVYAEGVRRGGTLVTARVDDARVADAQTILQSNKSVNLNERATAYEGEGWSTFDAKAPAYTPDEVRRERDRYNAAL